MSEIALAPLAYHRAVLAHVRRTDEAAWRSLHGRLGTPAAEPDDGHGGNSGTATVDDRGLPESLLRNAYRLEPAGHPELHEAARRAGTALGLTGPVEFFQVQGGPANASLLYQPDHTVILFSGSLLDLLDHDELTAICGHELAHQLLWTLDDGAYLAVDRLLDAAAGDARTPPQYLETGRRWAMACELFADRGALTACGNLATTVRALLKVQTGLAQVDPDAYLRQAAEVDLSSGSRGTSHPEGVARAWALRGWLAGEDVEGVVTGPLDVDAPDVLDAAMLRELAGRFASHVAAESELSSPVVATHAAAFFDPPPAELPTPAGPFPRFDEPLAMRPVDGLPMPRPRALTPATQRFLGYLLLDLATADPDTGDAGLSAAIRIARQAGLSTFEDLADDELGWSDKRRAELVAAASVERLW
ncbi:M48 family metalloprotease [Kribbella deserti]|uniref:M48 family metalloprotease n=1 Tax=Kribbella deserti TaxID=1926257 RepID=A0ABV6QRH1_9ACTN